MPLYEYRCLKCTRHTDKIENVNGPHLKKCPHCGGNVEMVITAPTFQFKGTGWYVTDYGRKKTGDNAWKGEKIEKSEKSEKSAKPESKPAPAAKEEKKSTSRSKEK